VCEAKMTLSESITVLECPVRKQENEKRSLKAGEDSMAEACVARREDRVGSVANWHVSFSYNNNSLSVYVAYYLSQQPLFFVPQLSQPLASGWWTWAGRLCCILAYKLHI